MRSRQNITDIFSTYVRFDHERFDGWLADPRLRANMAKCLRQVSDEQASKTFFALYWYRHWQAQNQSGRNQDAQNRLKKTRQGELSRRAIAHLTAHLQESAYWAAYHFSSRFTLKQFSLSDCFQVTFTKLEKALSSFNPEKGTSLESFAKLFFKSTIANELRRVREINVSSDWLLLRKLTKKQLIEALETVGGLDEKSVAQYRLIWVCYKQQYAAYREANTHRLASPTAETYEKIAALYNQERVSQLTFAAPKVEAAEVEACLVKSARWARRYLYPAIASLNVPSPGYDSGEAQDNLVDDEVMSGMDGVLAIAAETDRQQQQQMLSTELTKAIQQLKPPGEKLLRYYYCDGLKQKDIAQALEIKQYAVSRKLTQARSALLSALIAQRQSGKTVSADDAIDLDTIESMSNALELWLHDSFCQP